MPLRPTPELRFVLRQNPDAFRDINALGLHRVLQQKWNDAGSMWVGPNEPLFEWRDVPVIEEPANAGG